ncbi:MAG: hypothetical protein QM784_22815 [Polyangiaceae bacterium]
MDVWEEVVYNEDFEAARAAVMYVGIAAPQRPDSRFVSVFEQALTIDDEEVRVATFDAMSYPKWVELKQLAERAKKDDSSERVRWKANRLLEAFAHFGWDKLALPPA